MWFLRENISEVCERVLHYCLSRRQNFLWRISISFSGVGVIKFFAVFAITNMKMHGHLCSDSLVC